MRAKRLRRLVIVDDAGWLAGVVTLKGLLELLTRELAALAEAVLGSWDRAFDQRA